MTRPVEPLGDPMGEGDAESRAALVDRLNAEDLPSLAGFLGAYLHEDWQLEYGSAAEAAYAFIAEADLDDVEELAADWAVLVAATRDLDLDRVNLLLRQRFGSGWHLGAKLEIEAVAQELERALRE
ncbi:MAG: contact-dependent growth inhibition system immunity protein [Thermoanaerobaculia bacterium]